MNRVINFHDITDSAWFERLVLILKSKYTMVSILDIENYYYNGGVLKNACHITFDDGDKTFYEVVYPILKKHSIPASIFISPRMCEEGRNFWFQEISDYDKSQLKSIISDTLNIKRSILKKHSVFSILKCFTIDQIWNVIKQYQLKYNLGEKCALNMTVQEVREIDTDGLVAVGAHTINHPILANEKDEICEKEIVDSFVGLEKILGHKVDYFAFPNGWTKYDYGKREINVLKRCGCKIAFACTPGNFTLKNTPLAIRRYNLSYANLTFINAKLSLGEFWEFMKKYFKKGEISSRNKIYQAIRGNALQN
jgi:peptidoglycan/xylan/chitin deacetylase (PgdA/CDA1 family)